MLLLHFYTWNLKWLAPGTPTFSVLYVFSRCLLITLWIFPWKPPFCLHCYCHKQSQQLSLKDNPWHFHVSETFSREGRHSVGHSNSLWPTVCRLHWLAINGAVTPSQCPNHRLLCLVLMLGCPGVSWWDSGHLWLSEGRQHSHSMEYPFISLARHLLHNLISCVVTWAPKARISKEYWEETGGHVLVVSSTFCSWRGPEFNSQPQCKVAHRLRTTCTSRSKETRHLCPPRTPALMCPNLHRDTLCT